MKKVKKLCMPLLLGALLMAKYWVLRTCEITVASRITSGGSDRLFGQSSPILI